MSWTDVFPVFTEEQVDDFLTLATPDDRAELEEWYGVERIINHRPDSQEIVSVSLFWKPVRIGDQDLPVPTRERLQHAVELGFANRYNPWDHYIQPLLELTSELREKYPQTSIRVHLAKDMEFLADELVEVGCEVFLMKSSSINFAPGGLWRFLPFAEKDKLVIVTDIDRLRDLESDLIRTRTMKQSCVGTWRVPNPTDLNEASFVSYQPFVGCQFGIQGGLVDDVRLLLDAFTWHAMKGRLDPNVIMPGCGPMPIGNHTWPSYGFDEYFMNVAVYPRLAQSGMLTFVPTGARSILLALDVEYCTWGNPNSELIYFASGGCCGQTLEPSANAEQASNVIELMSLEADDTPPQEPKIAFLFLTQGDLAQPDIWREYFAEAGGRATILAHALGRERVGKNSPLWDGLLKGERVSNDSFQRSLLLLREALEDKNTTHFVLAGDGCVPVRSFAELSRGLRLDPRSRIKFQSWEEVRQTDILRAQKVQKLPGIRKELAHFHQPWLVFAREDAEVVAASTRSSAFERSEIGDESGFATLLAMEGRPPLRHVANRMTTWTNLEIPRKQRVPFGLVSSATIAHITESGCYFAREFSSDSNIGVFGLHRSAS